LVCLLLSQFFVYYVILTEITCRLPFVPAQPEPTFHLMEETIGYLFLKNADSTPAHGVAANSFLRET